MFVDFTGMNDLTLTNEFKQQLCSVPLLTKPGIGSDAGTWMHQRLYRPRDVAVVDEKIFFDIECCVATFEIGGVIVFDAVPEDQILRSRRSANRICLHEAHGLESAIQRGWFR